MARVDRTLKLTAQKEHFRALGADRRGSRGSRTSAPSTRGWRRKSPGPTVTGPPPRLPMVDLDGLKEINDKLGHAAGNRAIVALADAVREELRDTDFAARYAATSSWCSSRRPTSRRARNSPKRLRRRLVQVSQDAGLPGVAGHRRGGGDADELDSADAAEDLPAPRGRGALIPREAIGTDRVEVAHVQH